jgi:hypothetical protein
MRKRLPLTASRFIISRAGLSSRIGRVTSGKLIPLWSQGKDSFLKDNPNATLSIFSGDNVSYLVVEFSNPQLSGDDLTYDARILVNTPPTNGGACALFIDIIGMPT